MVKQKPIIAISAPVTITAGDAETKTPPKFESTFYTGGALNIDGWDLPVVVDLAGLRRGNVLVANLDHDRTKRVGNFDLDNDGKRLVAKGNANAKTAARDEVIGSAQEGYQWQSSLEVNPEHVETVKAGKTVTVNGQTFEGPLYVTRKGVLKGFAFVSHGADDNTSVTIAASAASTKGNAMDAACKTWIEGLGFNVEELSAEQLANLEADYKGKAGKRTAPVVEGASPAERRKLEAKRRIEINEIADQWMERREGDLQWINAIEELRDEAINAKKSVQDFRNDLYENLAVPQAHTVSTRVRNSGLTNRILEAALCQAGRLGDVEKHYTDQELQAAHDHFRDGIGLNQFLVLCAEANGYRGLSSSRVNKDVLKAAFGEGRQIRAAGFSTIDVANIVGAVANKFLHEGWMTVDQTHLRICTIRPVRNFQTVTTVSLTGALQYEKLGAAGEIKHGTLDELTYTNRADTYAAMLAITRQDIINDDLGALNAAPRRLGRGGALKLADIFWTEFLGLVGASFFASGNSNINTGVADMTLGGLEATETIFMNQTDPDGKPVGFTPKILLVPTALKAKAMALVADQPNTIVTGSDTKIPSVNVYAGRFRVESSPYISNSSYTGNTAVAWWMLADPMEAAVIEIAALNGRIEPTVDSTDADFNTLGIQMRGYCDVGVNEQEKRAGVHADGGSS